VFYAKEIGGMNKFKKAGELNWAILIKADKQLSEA